MTGTEFQDLVEYVSDNVNHVYDREAYELIGDRQPMPYELSDQIDEYAEEWCNENGIDPDEYYSEYSAEDVFFDDNYDFDA